MMQHIESMPLHEVVVGDTMVLDEGTFRIMARMNDGKVFLGSNVSTNEPTVIAKQSLIMRKGHFIDITDRPFVVIAEELVAF